MGNDGSGSYTNIIAGGLRKGRRRSGRGAWLHLQASNHPLPLSLLPAGMNWVRQHVQKNGWRGVVNMSLGGCVGGGDGAPTACGVFVQHASAPASSLTPAPPHCPSPTPFRPRSTALNDAAQALIDAGIPVVTSAGNKSGAGGWGQAWAGRGALSCD